MYDAGGKTKEHSSSSLCSTHYPQMTKKLSDEEISVQLKQQ